ncbi:hypothetical protein [Acidithiobacillus sp.]|uniref:hypothetical protein n=1 Tax=Acidithiobacillus sp. TaxID=1872118 RepID=UPI002582AA42|nr:hypothetical protein [Acidithiobacillus sp.]MDD5374429.1 hypothetical protein [Acidithiobacillus sp.]
MTWVLKNNEDKYLAPTVFSKFYHVTMGDLVPEQVYACRYYNRNHVASMAVQLGNGWRIIRLRSTSAKSDSDG